MLISASNLPQTCYYSLLNSGDGISEALLEASPVRADVALAPSLRVNHNTALVRSFLAVGEEGHLETAGGTRIRRHIKPELARVFCLHAIRDLDGILAIASPTAVVDKNGVGCRVTPTQLSRSSGSHLRNID